MGSFLVTESLANTGHITVDSGGALEISDGFTLSGGSIVVSAGGTETIEQGGTVYGADIYGVGYTDSGGVNSSTFVGTDGSQYVYGDSYYATIGYDGSQEVESGGYAYGTIDEYSQLVDAGGETVSVSALDGDQYVNGSAYYTVLSNGGGQYVYSGGLAYEAFIEGGGGFRVSSIPAGTADYAYVYSGGYQEVYGYSYGAYLYSGGVQYVESGGVASRI